MIGIGINNNVYLEKAAKVANKDNSEVLAITFAEADENAAKVKAAMEENPFADWESGDISHTESGNGLTLRMFPFDGKPPMNDPDKVVDGTEMRNRINSLRDPLVHILSQYMTTDKIPLTPKVMFRGTGIDTDPNSFATKIMSENVQAKVYANIADAFIEAITPFLGDQTKLFRLKLTRQSKNKAFAVLPTRFLKENPFMEPMEIPEKSSKLKFTNWEINNGFDKADPISQEKEADPVQEEIVDDPFAVHA